MKDTNLQHAEHFIRLQSDREGLVKRYIDEFIGFGVFAKQNFKKKDFLLEYKDLLVDPVIAESMDQEFVFYFKHAGKQYCIDGTESSGLARYVNDSPKRFANCSAKVVVVDGQPHVILFAVRDIMAGTELRYDYGGDVPWRKAPNATLQPYIVNDIEPSERLDTAEAQGIATDRQAVSYLSNVIETTERSQMTEQRNVDDEREQIVATVTSDIIDDESFRVTQLGEHKELNEQHNTDNNDKDGLSQNDSEETEHIENVEVSDAERITQAGGCKELKEQHDAADKVEDGPSQNDCVETEHIENIEASDTERITHAGGRKESKEQRDAADKVEDGPSQNDSEETEHIENVEASDTERITHAGGCKELKEQRDAADKVEYVLSQNKGEETEHIENVEAADDGTVSGNEVASDSDGVPSSVSLGDSVTGTNDLSPASIQISRFSHNNTGSSSASNSVESGMPFSGSCIKSFKKTNNTFAATGPKPGQMTNDRSPASVQASRLSCNKTGSPPTSGRVESDMPSSESCATFRKMNDQSSATVLKSRLSQNMTGNFSVPCMVKSGSRKNNSSTFSSQQYTLSVTGADTDNSTDDENIVSANRKKRKRVESESCEENETPNSNGEKTNTRKRQYTHWPKKDAEHVRKYFVDWISQSQSGQSTSLPCKSDILKFLNMNPEIRVDWTTVRNKVFNEKLAFAKRKQKRLNSLYDH